MGHHSAVAASPRVESCPEAPITYRPESPDADPVPCRLHQLLASPTSIYGEQWGAPPMQYHLDIGFRDSDHSMARHAGRTEFRPADVPSAFSVEFREDLGFWQTGFSGQGTPPVGLGLLLSGVAIGAGLDEPVAEAFHGESQFAGVSDLFESMGSEGSAALAIALYGYGRAFNDDAATDVGARAMRSLALSILPNRAFKAAFGRIRPGDGYTETGHYDASRFFEGGDSYMSGHSTQACAIFGSLGLSLHDAGHPGWGNLMYAMCGGAVLQRVSSGAHWLSDGIMGAGTGLSAALYERHRWSDSRPDNTAYKTEWSAGLVWFNVRFKDPSDIVSDIHTSLTPRPNTH